MINPHPKLPEFEYLQPTSWKEAVAFLAEHSHESRPFLGGTDSFVQMRDKVFKVKYMLDIKGLEGMDELAFDKKVGLKMGAAVNMNRVIASTETQQHYPVLVEAAREVGSYQLRTRATVVGNICNASPCGDTIAACMVCQGRLQIIGPDGPREEHLANFFHGPGQTTLKRGEIVKSLSLPIPPPGTRGKYISIGRNKLGDLAIAAVTVLGYPDKTSDSGYSFRIALSSVAPTVIFAPKAQTILAEETITPELLEKAAQLAMQASKPIDDIRGSARYRRDMIQSLTHKALGEVWEKLKGS